MAWFGAASLASAAYTSDPAASVTWNSPTSVTLFKDLNGFPAFGAVDHAADVLGSGDSAVWNFDLLAAGINPASVTGASISLSVALDSSANPGSDYYLSISTPIAPGAVYPGFLVNHGSPGGGPYINWSSLSPYLSYSGSFPATLAVTGSASMLAPANGPSDFIAIDSISLNLTIAPVPAPEPGTMVAGAGALLVVFAGVARRVRR
jgi:hypothetical protein